MNELTPLILRALELLVTGLQKENENLRAQLDEMLLDLSFANETIEMLEAEAEDSYGK